MHRVALIWAVDTAPCLPYVSVMTFVHPERRRVSRTAANISAVVVSEGGVTRRPAKIRNVSPTGALVELTGGEELAGEVYLLLPECQMQPCKPVWRKGDEVGVSYPERER